MPLKAFIHQARHKSFDRQCYDVSPVLMQRLARGQSHLRLINTPLVLYSHSLGGGVNGKMYHLCFGYSCRVSHRQVNGNIIEWPQL